VLDEYGYVAKKMWQELQIINIQNPHLIYKNFEIVISKYSDI